VYICAADNLNSHLFCGGRLAVIFLIELLNCILTRDGFAACSEGNNVLLKHSATNPRLPQLTWCPPLPSQESGRVLNAALLAGAAFVLLLILVFTKGDHVETVQRVYTSLAGTSVGQEPQPPPSPSLKPWDLPSGSARVHFTSDPSVVPRLATTFDAFLHELKASLDRNQLRYRPVELIFNETYYFSDLPHPACSGLWLEFGVFNGWTLNMTARFRERFCGLDSGTVVGFDTFEGLPEQWAGGFQAGAFSLGGNLPPVRDNAELVKGLFSDSLPPWIEQQKEKNGGMLPPVTYLHIDCDLYAGARDALMILMDHLAPGCIIIFDEVSRCSLFCSQRGAQPSSATHLPTVGTHDVINSLSSPFCAVASLPRV